MAFDGDKPRRCPNQQARRQFLHAVDFDDDAQFGDHPGDDGRIVTIAGGEHNDIYAGRKIEHVDGDADVPVTLGRAIGPLNEGLQPDVPPVLG